jgi:glycosyltransferase involved in cell wall biosynthesis
MEVIFVDDGSEDNTLFEILKYAPRMNMKYTAYHHEWKGLGYSRNVVLKNAQGDYIVWVDDGTIIPKDYVRKQVEFMEKHPDVGIARGIIGAYSGSNCVATLENMIQLAFSHKYAGKVTTKLPGAGGSIYRVKAAKHAGGFNESIQGAAEDTEIAHRILLAGWQIHITQANFFIDYNENLKKVWDKSFRYGYGSHFILHEHKKLREILYKSTPLAGFIEGIFASCAAYKFTHKKIAFLLPIYFFVKRIFWCLGFTKSHIDSYDPHRRYHLVAKPR